MKYYSSAELTAILTELGFIIIKVFDAKLEEIQSNPELEKHYCDALRSIIYLNKALEEASNKKHIPGSSKLNIKTVKKGDRTFSLIDGGRE